MIRVLFILTLVFVLIISSCSVRTPPSPSPTPMPAPGSSPVADVPPGYVDVAAVDSSEISFNSESFSIKAYLAKPKSSGSFPGLIIIHENRGLTPHIQDVARRFANQGYIALAPDLLSRIGGIGLFSSTDNVVAAIRTLSSDNVIMDINSAFAYLQSLPDVQKDNIGVIGYCWGGGNSLLFATRNSAIKAAIVYYGSNPANLDDVANISAPVLGIYGELDNRISMNVPALVEAMERFNKSFEYKMYPGAAHAFFNDTGANYSAEAAQQAWQVTLSFLSNNLKTGR